ncbi:pseudouridine synthase [Roseateles sp. BYS180W]|uniref:Pseudouridine synthase n=1 Tax=Roseateles rivi TaxID=3299028 RepID=A0ABW7FUJ5_9BURK
MARPPKPELPLRDGVAASVLACPSGPWATVLDFLSERLPLVAREDWAQRLSSGAVLNAQGLALALDAPYRGGTRLYYWRWREQEPEVPFEAHILYRDEHLLVADKPHFLPVTPKGRYVQQTLLTRLRRATGLAELSPLHRLDRETAGLVLFAVHAQARDAYQALFRERRVHKVYEAIAPWRPELSEPRCLAHRLQQHPEHFMQMQVLDGEPNAWTQLRLIERLPDAHGQAWARYGLRPSTGLKHQLRAQMCAVGAPLLGDRIYPTLLPHEEQPDFSAPLQLLARELALQDPLSGVCHRWRSERMLNGLDMPNFNPANQGVLPP